jgi:hypothetical protein
MHILPTSGNVPNELHKIRILKGFWEVAPYQWEKSFGRTYCLQIQDFRITKIFSDFLDLDDIGSKILQLFTRRCNVMSPKT